jgi:hypothetical protein
MTGSPRLAVTPPGAILDYCYALLESETRLAASVLGLDPGIGERSPGKTGLWRQQSLRPAPQWLKWNLAPASFQGRRSLRARDGTSVYERCEPGNAMARDFVVGFVSATFAKRE